MFLQQCRTALSVRKGSFFEKSHLRLSNVVMLIFLWCMDEPLENIQTHAEVSHNAAVDWCKFIREVRYNFFDVVVMMYHFVDIQ